MLDRNKTETEQTTPKKWYQKNSPLTVVIMLLAFAFLGFAVYFFVMSQFKLICSAPPAKQVCLAGFSFSSGFNTPPA